MIQACCHFLYPIVLNPWCTSSLHLRGTCADLESAALPILDISYQITDSAWQLILCIVYISATFHSDS
jgi:hypothetical protein